MRQFNLIKSCLCLSLNGNPHYNDVSPSKIFDSKQQITLPEQGAICILQAMTFYIRLFTDSL